MGNWRFRWQSTSTDAGLKIDRTEYFYRISRYRELFATTPHPTTTEGVGQTSTTAKLGNRDMSLGRRWSLWACPGRATARQSISL